MELPRSLPANENLPPALIEDFVRGLETRSFPLRSLLIAKNGKLVFEKYYEPFDRHSLQRMFSVTKSFVSLAVGLLEAQGRLNLQDRIAAYFPEYAAGIHPWIKAMKIEDMLKMQSCHSMTTYNKKSTTENWVESFFKQKPTHPAGTLFMYDTSSSHTLAALVEKLSRQKLLDFLRAECLDRIGFSRAAYIIPDPFGCSMGGSGLMASSEDILRVGLLLLNHGRDILRYGEAEAPEIYPDSYIQRAISRQTATQVKIREEGYGYQFWQPFEGAFSMYGMGDQHMIALPAYDMILVITADTQGIPGNPEFVYEKIQRLTAALTQPGTQSSYAPPPCPPAPEGSSLPSPFASRAGSLPLPSASEDASLPAPLASENASLPILPQSGIRGLCQYREREYLLKARKNQESRFQSLSVSFDSEKGTLSYRLNGQACRLPFGFGRLEYAVFPLTESSCASSAAWKDPHTLFILSWIYGEITSSVRFRISFSEEHVTVHMAKTDEVFLEEYQGFLNGQHQE